MISNQIQTDRAPRTSTVRRSASISVIVPVRNEEAFIARTLDQLLEQERDGIEVEILVVDGRSTDRTRSIVERYAERFSEIHLLDNPQRLSSAARNVAVKHASGDYLVVIDGHCEIPSRRYFQDLAHAFEDSKADCLGRPQPLDVSQATRLQRAIAAARSSWLGHHPDSLIYTDREVDCPAASVAIAYRRSVFEKIGLFDERFDACEDYELNHRIDSAGLRCRLIPRLSVKYEPRKTLGGLFRQMFRYGRGRVRLFRKHRAQLTCRTLVPGVFVLGVVLGPIWCAALPMFWPFYSLALALYLVMIVGESCRLAAVGRDARLFLWLPAVFGMIHVASGCGLLWELVRRSPVEQSSV